MTFGLKEGIPLLHFLLTLFVFIVSIISYVKLNSKHHSFLTGLGTNWNKGPILSITPRIGNCRFGEEALMDQEWPGTEEGCDCGSLFGLSKGRCRRSKYYNYCNNVPALSPNPYYSWGYSMFCGSRIPQSYFDLKLATSPETCPTGSRSCGIADTTLQVLCIENKNQCPINKLLILESIDELPKDFNYITYKLGNDKILAYTNENIKGEIVHEFYISERKPCINPGYFNLNMEPYKLSKTYDRQGCPKLDSGISEEDRVTLIDSDSLYNINDMNKIESRLSVLPYYMHPPLNVQTGLYVKEYYGLGKFCRNNIKDIGITVFLQNLVIFEDKIESIQYFALVLMILTIIVFVINLVIYVISLCADEEVNKENGLLIYYFISSIILLIFSIVVTVKTYSLPTDYKYLTDIDCGDSITYEIANSFENNYGMGMILSMVLTCSFVPLVTYPIFAFFVEPSHKSFEDEVN